MSTTTVGTKERGTTPPPRKSCSKHTGIRHIGGNMLPPRAMVVQDTAPCQLTPRPHHRACLLPLQLRQAVGVARQATVK